MGIENPDHFTGAALFQGNPAAIVASAPQTFIAIVRNGVGDYDIQVDPSLPNPGLLTFNLQLMNGAQGSVIFGDPPVNPDFDIRVLVRDLASNPVDADFAIGGWFFLWEIQGTPLAP